MYSAIHKGGSQTEGERERERWIRDPCGPCTDINESPGYYCCQFPHPIRSSACRVLRVSLWKREVHHRPTENTGFYSTSDPSTWGLTHTHTHTHTHTPGGVFTGSFKCQWCSKFEDFSSEISFSFSDSSFRHVWNHFHFSTLLSARIWHQYCLAIRWSPKSSIHFEEEHENQN